MFKKIVNTIDTCGGSPRIDGTRLTCGNIVNILTYQLPSLEDFFLTYDYLNKNDIKECLTYCMKKKCISDHVISFCQGCSLLNDESQVPDGYINSINDLNQEIKRNKNFNHIFLGTENDYVDNEIGEDLWVKAEELFKKFYS